MELKHLPKTGATKANEHEDTFPFFPVTQQFHSRDHNLQEVSRTQKETQKDVYCKAFVTEKNGRKKQLNV